MSSISDSDAPTTSSYLLGSGNSGSRYTNERPVTPAENIIREEWYDTLSSSFHYQWQDIKELYDGSWRAFCGRKLKAIFRCFCLPCLVLRRALNGRHQYFKYQTGIMYLYVYLCFSVVVNLVVALKNVNFSMAEYIQKLFVIWSTFPAIALMVYLYLAAYDKVKHPPRTRGAFLRVIYLGGMYLFGILSFGYSMAIVIDNVSCGQMLNAVLTVIKAVFTVSQILFLHYFYDARIPDDTPFIQITLAHFLGTNLALWFWTLCSEQAEDAPDKCVDYPIDLARWDKYFLPFFVEFLLLGASLFYQIWINLEPGERKAANRNQRHCPTCYCNLEQFTNLVENTWSKGRNPNDNATRSSSPGLGLFIGSCFAAFFIILIIMAKDTGASHQSYHIAYSFGIFVLFLAEILACLICKLSLQSHQHDTDHFSVDHDDILLYISLIGVLLWEGFHAYSIMGDLVNASRYLDLGNDLIAIVHHLFQTVILIELRRHKRAEGELSAWICQCVLFLIFTNLAFWVQDSFFIEVQITTPGEAYARIQKDLKTIGYILHPLSIFFRFHSSVCCVIAWDRFRIKQES